MKKQNTHQGVLFLRTQEKSSDARHGEAISGNVLIVRWKKSRGSVTTQMEAFLGSLLAGEIYDTKYLLQ